MATSRLKSQWQCGIFALSTVDGNTVDVEKTFKPKPKVTLLFVKSAFVGWVIQVIAQSITKFGRPAYWMAYLSNLESVLILAYFAFSVLLMSPLISVANLTSNEESGTASIWTKAVWFFYTLSINVGLIVTILFWVIVYSPGSGDMYIQVMVHGGIVIMVLIDGMVINRIPIRLKQLLWVEFFAILYLLWLIIYEFTYPDVLYTSIDFEKSPVFSSILPRYVDLNADEDKINEEENV